MDCEAGAGKGTRAASGRTRRQPVLLRQKPPRPRMFAHQPRGTLPRQFVNLGSHHFQSRSYAVISAEERYPVSSSGCEEGDGCGQWASCCKRGAERSQGAGAGAAAAKVLAGLPHSQPLAIYSCARTHCSPGHSHRHGLNINLKENTVGEEI